MARDRDDLLILGGGLAGALTALVMRRVNPELSVSIVERDATLGGNHIWSFFDSDIERANRSFVAPLIARSWPRHRVRFPAYERVIDYGYSSITSERLDAVVRAELGEEKLVTGEVVEAGPERAVLADGTMLQAGAVLDARGLDKSPEGLHCSYQKFVGRMLQVVGGHGIAEPVIMDATVPQTDGYRFVYLLPFSETEIFVEDTYYHDDTELDVDTLLRRIAHYAKLHDWQAEPEGRLEAGVLPVVTGGRFDELWPVGATVARAGVRGGFFHPLTSYSLPDAVRTAALVADLMPCDGVTLAREVRAFAKGHWKHGRFDRMLARMLFDAADPSERYRILERFYRLPPELIGRFYAGRSTRADRLRILAGKPPVAIHRALRAILGKK